MEQSMPMQACIERQRKFTETYGIPLDLVPIILDSIKWKIKSNHDDKGNEKLQNSSVSWAMPSEPQKRENMTGGVSHHEVEYGKAHMEKPKIFRR